MKTELYSAEYLPEFLQSRYLTFLNACGLREEHDTDFTALYMDDDGRILACGSLRGNVLKQIAVSPAAEGEGLCAGIVSELVSRAVERGETQLFLYTKPQHLRMFSSLGFYSVVSTGDMLMMENRRRGLQDFLDALPHPSGRVGCVVCNCNPFTLGHRHLMEYASARCDALLVFVLSEELSMFPAEDRFELVKAGTAEFKNVHVLKSRDYIISRATFPTYFIKEQADCEKAACSLDVALFAGRIAPALNISVRFVGQEPFDPVTRAYNEMLARELPKFGIELEEIPRYEGISAGQVRRLLQEGKLEEAGKFLPQTSYEYCKRHFGAGTAISG